MTEHDPLCISQEFLPADLTRFCDCERVRAIRADEQGKALDSLLAANQRRVQEWDEFRAKVEVLPHSRWVGTAWVLRDDVLALIDGEQQ